MAKVSIATIIFYDEEGRVLLHNRDDSRDFWSLLGGGIQNGETPLEAIKREMFEEIGYELSESLDQLIHVQSLDIPLNSEKEATVALFKAKFPGFSQLRNTDEVKLEELQFFALTQLQELSMLPIAKYVFENIADGLN